MNDSSYKYIVSTSPHITNGRTTRGVMFDVIVALMPAVIASFLLYGLYTLLMTAVCVASAVFGEYLYNLIRKKPHTVNDLSAVVTGILLGLNLTPTVPVYVPIIGGIFATLVVKMLFGGLGKNFANPAITARIFVMLAWTTAMTTFVAPIDLSNGGAELIKYFNHLLMTAVCVASAVFGEYLYNLIRKKPHTVNDLSAVVTGILLGLNLTPTVPVYVPIIGGIFATLVVKMLFGGLGKNFANPAITARIFVMLAWTTAMTTFVAPIDLSNGGAELIKYFNHDTVNALTSATPLVGLKEGAVNASALDLFLGRTGGSAGETCALALIIGGVYLAIRKVIDVKIPLIFILTYFLVTLAIYKDANVAGCGILSGGLLLGAIFMATDYSTSPDTVIGTCIYAFGCGLLTAIFRKYGSMPEGVSFAILLMNVVTPLLDKYIRPRPFGYVKPVKPKKGKKSEKEAQA